MSIHSFQEYKNGKVKPTKNWFWSKWLAVFSVSYFENNNILALKNVLELNRYNGFVKREFRTSAETIYRTGYCKSEKKVIFYNILSKNFLLRSCLL